MRQKMVLGRRAVPKRVRLPDGTSFVARYETISRKSLPGNIRVTKTRTIGPGNKRTARVKKKEQGLTWQIHRHKTGPEKSKKKIQKITIWQGTS